MLRIRRRPFAAGLALAAVLLLSATPATPAALEERTPELTFAARLWEWLGAVFEPREGERDDPVTPTAGSADAQRPVGMRGKGGEIDPNG